MGYSASQQEWTQGRGKLTTEGAFRAHSAFSILCVLWMALQLEMLVRESRAAQNWRKRGKMPGLAQASGKQSNWPDGYGWEKEPKL